MTTAREEAERRIMTDRDQIIEAMAKVLFVMQHRVEVSTFHRKEYAGMAQAATREATNALDAALPLITASLNAQQPVEITDGMVERAALAGLNAERRRHGLDAQSTLDSFDAQTRQEWREDTRAALQAALGGEA